MLSGDGRDHEHLVNFAVLREDLQALDLKYMLLGPESLFETFDSLGLLNHRLANAPKPRRDAHNLPLPPRGRARLRGELVRQHGCNAAEPDAGCRRYSATWSRFMDRENGRVIDMPDVREAKNIWQDAEELTDLERNTALRLPNAPPGPFSGPF
jgi:hypothetical protein